MQVASARRPPMRAAGRRGAMSFRGPHHGYEGGRGSAFSADPAPSSLRSAAARCRRPTPGISSRPATWIELATGVSGFRPTSRVRCRRHVGGAAIPRSFDAAGCAGGGARRRSSSGTLVAARTVSRRRRAARAAETTARVMAERGADRGARRAQGRARARAEVERAASERAAAQDYAASATRERAAGTTRDCAAGAIARPRSRRNARICAAAQGVIARRRNAEIERTATTRATEAAPARRRDARDTWRG